MSHSMTVAGELPAIAPEVFRAALGSFCSGVTVVTAVHDGTPVGFACQSFSSLSLDPPMVLLCPAKSSTTWPRIAAAGHFTVNVLAAHQRDVCQSFAVSGGDKFDGRSWQPSSHTGAPVLAEVLASIDCVLEVEHDGGDHTIAIARVLHLEHRGGAPLLFFRGGFRGITPSAR